MRTAIFFLMLAAMLGGGIYIASQKMGVQVGPDFIDGGVSPAREWHDQMIGVWKYESRLSNPRELWVFTGRVEYLPDGKFIRQVTGRFYKDGAGEPDEHESDLGIVTGGTVEGTWKVDTVQGNWQETATECALSNSIVEQGFNEKYDACVWFNRGYPTIYGNQVTTFSRSDVSVFTAEKILIEGESFSDGGMNTWSLKKVK